MKGKHMLMAAAAMTMAAGISGASYASPALTAKSDILGMADTGNKTTLKVDLIYTHGPGDINLYHYDEAGNRVVYEDEQNIVVPLEPVSYTGSAVLKLEGDVDDERIDSSHAVVRLLDGNSYSADEFILLADSLDGAWENGTYVYTLSEGDLLFNTWDYDTTADYNSDREWSIMGGDGCGVYNFTFEVSGIRYDGEEIPPATFPAAVYIYGRTCTDISLSTEFVENTVDESYMSDVEPSDDIQWDWYTDNASSMADEKPYMNDAFTDYFTVIWPVGTDAGAITADDVTVTLYSSYGDAYTLSEETAYGEHEYAVFSDGEKTRIAVTYQQWAFVPVYSSLAVTVDNGSLFASRTFDICSVAIYSVQTGGGGVTADHTVTCYNYYGIGGMTLENAADVRYTLSTEADGKTMFYAEDADGNGYLVDGIETTVKRGNREITEISAPEEAFRGDGTEKYHIAVRGNVLFVETRLDTTEEKTVDGETIVFQQNLNVRKNIEQIIADGAYLKDGFNLAGAGPEKWAWTMRYQSGWTLGSPKPEGLPYIAGAYGYGYEPGSVNPVYAEEKAAMKAAAAGGPMGGPGGPEGPDGR